MPSERAGIVVAECPVSRLGFVAILDKEERSRALA
jgi:L-lactate utilization protein LutC